MALYKTNSTLLLLALLFVISCGHQSFNTTTGPKVKKLIAFSKVYGYVKYFHPSDEAREINWDKLAVLGVKKVKKAKAKDELKKALEALFLPIAPTITFFETEPDSNVFLSRYLERIGKDTTGLETVAWQHLGVDMEQSSRVYTSSRINRQDKAWNRNFTLFQLLDAQKFRGSSVQLQATIRTEVEGSGNEGELFLRVNDKMGRPITIEHITNNSITSHGWNEYKIESQISNKAHQIVVGVKLKGEGKLWVDDLKLVTVGHENNKTAVTLQNPGFENQDSGRPIGWRSTVTGRYDFKVASGKSYKGNNSFYMASKDSNSPDYLFDTHAQIGETATKQIAEGLWIEVPLALYSDEAHTLPRSSQTDFNCLKKELEGIDLTGAAGNKEDIWLADVIIAWNELQHFYPYFDAIDTDWEAQLRISIKKALADDTQKEFSATLSRMLASTRDGHIILRHFSINNSNEASLPFSVDWIENKVVVTHSLYEQIQPGDIVISLNGESATKIVQDQRTLISGSPQLTLFRSLRQLGAGASGTEVTVEIKNEEGVESYTIPRSSRRSNSIMYEKDLPVTGQIEDGIYYVDLTKTLMSRINKEMDQIASSPGVIFDLRGYPTKNSYQVISHLLTQADTSKQWMKIPKIIYPDQKKIVGYLNNGWQLKPAKPHIQGKVVFLTDERAISYAESFMSFIEHYNLGEIVGQPTAGTNGNINTTALPVDYQYAWTGMKVVKHDGSQLFQEGIQPTIPVEKTIQGVREGKDEFLEKAIHILQ